ncbi:MAG: histidine kinase [Deltaproteobacteria bacterium]|nr:MAG: histidine kinase [Deltaproteobacteria bacterium]
MKWWQYIGLRKRVFITLGCLVLITFLGGAVMIWYTYQMDAMVAGIIEKNTAALEVTSDLEIALVNQKGFVSYFFIDRNPEWLDRLYEQRIAFNNRLKNAYELILSQEEREIVDKIKFQNIQYTRFKDQVIELYKIGNLKKGAELHKMVRPLFFQILDLCNDLMDFQKTEMRIRTNKIKADSKKYRAIAGSAMLISLLFGCFLAIVLVKQIFEPIRKLSNVTGKKNSNIRGNEVSSLKNQVYDLIEDADVAKSELKQSRDKLLNSEKMAMMGKLAAETAHTIRNPMTSIKMRLFSLERSLQLNSNQKEDFEVVSVEMGRLDKILRNFLEFTRLPKLKVQKINVSKLFNMVFQLLSHQIAKKNIIIENFKKKLLLDIYGDPELLKEVFINLVVNALDAMQDGGRIKICWEEVIQEKIGRAILITISDTGPGIPEPVCEKVFDPFFSTKEDGTGLGLSIARRIIEEHGGEINLHSKEGVGTTFSIIFPLREDNL